MWWNKLWNHKGENSKETRRRIMESRDVCQKSSLDEENINWWKSMISHNFRMPLAIIDGFAKMLQEGDIAEPKAQQECIHKICDNIEYLITLMALVLDDKEILQKRGEICESVNLLATIRQVCGYVANMAKKNETEIRLAASEDNIQVFMDKMDLMHIFYNLIENSFKYMGRSGMIQITVSTIDQKEILVVYKDTGIGMHKEQAAHIFEKHYQGSNKKWGNGMGMYLVSEIIKKANGSIYAVSDIDKGMGIYMKFPIAR